jgi:hypothetical protein
MLDKPLELQLGSLSLNDWVPTQATSPSPPPPRKLGKLAFCEGSPNTLVPQAHLLELVTRTKWTLKSYDRKQIYPHLALGQIPALIIAVHQRETFTQIRHEKMASSEKLLKAGQDTQGSFRRLRVLLETLRDVTCALREECVTGIAVVCRNKKLEVFARETNSQLPAEFLSKFTETRT